MTVENHNQERQRETYGHAMGILALLRRAEKLPDDQWKGKAQTREEYIEQLERFVQEDLEAGILSPEDLSE